MKYFADTYAFLEIVKGNPNYKKYLTQHLYTSVLNLYELYYILLRDYEETTAKKYFLQFKEFVLIIKDEYLFEASKIKLTYAKKKISYTDALGYAMALAFNMKFLTGDSAFKEMANVEYVL